MTCAWLHDPLFVASTVRAESPEPAQTEDKTAPTNRLGTLCPSLGAPEDQPWLEMTSADLSKRILAAASEVLPGHGDSLVARIDIRDGWGDITYVRIYSPLSRTATNQDLWTTLRAAIETELADRRHRVDILWNSAG